MTTKKDEILFEKLRLCTKEIRSLCNIGLSGNFYSVKVMFHDIQELADTCLSLIGESKVSNGSKDCGKLECSD